MPKVLVKIPAKKSKIYAIQIKKDLLQHPEQWLPKKIHAVAIITDHLVKKKYGLDLANKLRQMHYSVVLVSFPAGESSKMGKTKAYLETCLLKAGLSRNTLCLALGGGVVGDIAGFTAATYMRGIPLIQIPTTLLAMVDSSVGGKTSIDHPLGKNLIGAFWQPEAVIVDPNCLQSLSKTHLINGLIEAIKMFLTHDKKSFDYIEKNIARCLQGNEDILQSIIQRSVKIKSAVVARDETEQHERMTLNFGHTIGHALEKVSGYQLLHGYCVAYGILWEAKIAELQGILAPKNYTRIAALFAQLNITSKHLHRYSLKAILQAAKLDKKKKDREVRYVLLQDIGKFYVSRHQFAHPVDDVLVKQAFKQMMENSGETYGGK